MTEINQEQMTVLTKEYLELNKKISELEDRKDAIKSEMQVNLELADLTAWEDLDGNSVSKSSYIKRTLDKDKVLTFVGDVEKFNDLFSETTVNQFRITNKEQSGRFGKKKVQK